MCLGSFQAEFKRSQEDHNRLGSQQQHFLKRAMTFSSAVSLSHFPWYGPSHPHIHTLFVQYNPPKVINSHTNKNERWKYTWTFMHWGKKSWMCNKQGRGEKNRLFRKKVGPKSIFFKADRSQYSKSNWESSSYSLDLVSNNHGVLFANLVSSFGFVVVRTVMLIGVTVKSTEQIPTAAVKTWNITAEDRPSQINNKCSQWQSIPNCTHPGTLQRHDVYLKNSSPVAGDDVNCWLEQVC